MDIGQLQNSRNPRQVRACQLLDPCGGEKHSQNPRQSTCERSVGRDNALGGATAYEMRLNASRDVNRAATKRREPLTEASFATFRPSLLYGKDSKYGGGMSEVEINVNEIAGHAAADLVESFFSSMGNTTKDQIAKYKIRFGSGFSSYLTETLARYSRFKTLINRHDSINLDDNYVPTRIRDENVVFRSDDFFSELVEKKRFIIEGTAGLGKTLFVRNMLRHTILYERKYIPILFELRNLHLDNTLSLTANLVKQVSDYIPGFNEDHFRFGLERGKFIIYLDGIDEISLEDRSRYASEILDMAYRFTETPILLSTRPDDFYLPWEVFRVARLQPMTRDQTVLMLSKLQYDPEIKNSFIETITPDFFREHAEFLPTPLLATLMMLTYSEYATAPSKMHVFYEQAFQTLFHKHDFIKGAYSRTIESKLDVEQFRQVLAAFCFVSYLQERFSFLQFQVLEDVRSALALAGIDADKDDFLKDLLVTVCLLQRDGNHITFVHRSFQEYFAALFISRSPPSEIFDIIEALVSRARVDAVIRMIVQLNDGLVEQEWVLPKLRELEGFFEGRKSDLGLIRATLGNPHFHRGLTFNGPAKIDRHSLGIILGEYSHSERQGADDYVDDSRAIAKYLDEQQMLADKEQPYNRAALGARKRELQGHSLNLAALPADLVSGLRCVREMAADLRRLREIKQRLEDDHVKRSNGIRGLLSKYKK